MSTRDALRHQGAENSALKNSAPSSLTTLKTSESTSICHSLTELGVPCQEYGTIDQVFKTACRIVELDREVRGPITIEEGDNQHECDCERDTDDKIRPAQDSPEGQPG